MENFKSACSPLLTTTNVKRSILSTGIGTTDRVLDGARSPLLTIPTSGPMRPTRQDFAMCGTPDDGRTLARAVSLPMKPLNAVQIGQFVRHCEHLTGAGFRAE